MMTSSQTHVPDAPTGAAFALYAREHDLLERLHVLRGQIDYLRAQASPVQSPADDSASRRMLSRLEHSYATAEREYEQVRTARLVSGTTQGTNGPTDHAPWDGMAGAALWVSVAALGWIVATRLARRVR